MRVAELIDILSGHDDDQVVYIASGRTQYHVDDVRAAADSADTFAVYIIEGDHPSDAPYSPGEVR